LADAVKRLGAARFDIIFLDPPYGADTLVDAVTLAGSVAAAETVIVIEHASAHESPAVNGALARVRVMRSGDSALSFYRRVETA
jgi:16S rRNA G966 N2-methylase RsmD